MKKISNIITSQWSKLLSVFFFIILVSAYTNIFAVFTPGETLDPNCAPGTSGCVVSSGSSASQWTTDGSDIYFTGGKVGVGTNNPTNSLTVNGGALFGHGSTYYAPGFVAKGTYTLDGDNNIISFITKGNYAYALFRNNNDNNYSLSILNISDPDSISLISNTILSTFFSGGGVGHSIDISGDDLYINSDNGIVIYNISNKENPSYIKTTANDTNPSSSSIRVYNNKLYASYNNIYDEVNGIYYNTVLIYDIADKENPVYLDEIRSDSYSFYNLYITDNYIYTLVDGGAFIYDSNTLEQLGSIEIGHSYAIDLVVYNNYLYIPTFNSTFYIFNVTDPSNPQLEDSFETANAESSVVISGNYAYVGDTQMDTLYMLDISDPTNIREVDSIVNDNIRNIAYLSMSNGYLFAYDWSVNTISALSVDQKTVYGNSIDSTGGVAIGSYAGVSSALNGGLIISGNVGIGTDNPIAKLNIQLGDDETKTILIKDSHGGNIFSFGNDNDENSNLFVGTLAGDGISNFLNSNFLGDYAGYQATNASNSTFIGSGAGYEATNASDSVFLGPQAGYGASNVIYSNFFGKMSGYYAETAYQSNFLGYYSGFGAYSANNSNFLGYATGVNAYNASDSNFLGYNAGSQATNASNSIFIGHNSGYGDTVDNTTNGLSSILLGSFTNTGGHSNSILLGSGISGSPISNTKANQFMLAPSVTELSLAGIEYTLPSSQASALGQVLTNDGSGGLSWTSSGGLISSVGTYGLSTTSLGSGSSDYSNFFGYQSGYQVTTANGSNFLGYRVGYLATNASGSNFLGSHAGNQATNANNSNFLGSQAGIWATNASYSNFFGSNAGYQAAEANNSNFLGINTGQQATNADNSNFFGAASGYQATNASNSNFFGANTGQFATNASFSNFFGNQAGFSSANARNSIFIGQQAGYADTVNNTGDINDFSILIGKDTSTGGFSNSIAIGGSAVNTASNQLTIGSVTRPINKLYIAGVSYDLPTSQGGAGTVLTNNGSGGLTWSTVAGGLSSDSDFNTKGGTNAGLNLVAGAQGNTFLGYDAGRSASSSGTNEADYNTAIGYQSLFSNTSGHYNTASGYQALYSNTTGINNIADGYQSLYSNTTGQHNTAIGYQSLRLNTTGSSNTGVGLFSLTANTTGIANVALGGSLLSNTTGSYNTASGNSSMANNTTGEYNTASGFYSLGSNVTGSNGVAMGFEAMRYANDTTTPWTNYNTAIGFQSMRGSATPANNTGNYNTATGYQSLYSNTTGYDNTAFGYFSLNKNTSGYNNTSVGYVSLNQNTTGNNNTAVGQQSLSGNSTGGENTAVGFSSQRSNTTGNGNSSFGVSSLSNNTLGSNNSAFGYQAMIDNQGSNNAAIGYNSLYKITTGYNNIAMGSHSGRYIVNGSTSNQTSNNSLYLGHDTRALADGDTNEIVIGSSSIGRGSNTAQWGNTSITNHYFSGSVQFSSYGAGTLTTDASGNITASSDERLKDIQGDFNNNNNALNTILSINPILYKWNSISGYDKDTTYAGFSAQNIQSVIPEAIGVDPRGYLTISDRPILATVVNAIKEMNLKVEDLSSLDVNSSTSLGYLVKDFLGNIGNSIDIVFFGEVHTKKLCLDDLCITKDQLQQILNNNNVSTTIIENSTDTILDSNDTDTEVDTNDGEDIADGEVEPVIENKPDTVEDIKEEVSVPQEENSSSDSLSSTNNVDEPKSVE